MGALKALAEMIAKKCTRYSYMSGFFVFLQLKRGKDPAILSGMLVISGRKKILE